MKNRNAFYYSVIVLLITILSPVSSFAQCGDVEEMNLDVRLGRTFNFQECPPSVPLLGGVMVYMTINNTPACFYKSNPSSRVIYWPMNVRMDWNFQQERRSDDFSYCPEPGFFQTSNGTVTYAGSTSPQPFIPTQPGLYKLGGRAVLKVRGMNIKLVWKKWRFVIERTWTYCPDVTLAKQDEILFMNICVVDVGGKPIITTASPCGDNILHGPENTATYSYFWQTTPYGTDMTNGGSNFTIYSSGTYYLRARHNATGVWGEAGAINATYNGGTTVTTPTPAASGNVCGEVSLTMPAAPPTVTYYWQGTSCGTDMTKPATSPYPVNLIGQTYYVRAHNGFCWSDCAQITPTVNAIQPPKVTDIYACSCDLHTDGTTPMNVSLNATPTAPGNTCRWYTSMGSTSPVYTGNTYVAATRVNVTYYVSSYNSSSGCESARVPVKIIFKSCSKCLDGLMPIVGKKYVISAWVKEQNGFEATTYNNANITLVFNGAANPVSDQFKASGEIIEGWQKIEKEFLIPANTTGLKIQLNNGGGSNDVFFDDIRLFPFDGNMVSYVYDPLTLKLVAELDANNYATYYVYDDEGKLTKVKKETSAGIKTIKEGRSNTVIKP